jgi:membrane protease YdiL (CAAX protease family)
MTERSFDPAVAKYLSYLVIPLILFVLLFPYLRQHRLQLLSLVRLPDLTLRVALLSLLLGLTLRVTWWSTNTVLIAAGAIGSNDVGGPGGLLLGFGCPPQDILLLGILVMSVVVPLVEETMCRGLILHTLLPRGKVVAIVASAFIFAALHNPASYWIAFYIGVFLALQTLNYHTLWGPLLTHAAYNMAMIFDWTCVQVTWNPSPEDPRLAVIGAVCAATTVLACVVSALLVSRKAVGRHQCRESKRTPAGARQRLRTSARQVNPVRPAAGTAPGAPAGSAGEVRETETSVTTL